MSRKAILYTEWNNEAWTHIAMSAWRDSLFRRFTDTNVYGTGSVKMRKTRRKICVDIRTFFTVYIFIFIHRKR